jgi:hypothetical protein
VILAEATQRDARILRIVSESDRRFGQTQKCSEGPRRAAKAMPGRTCAVQGGAPVTSCMSNVLGSYLNSESCVFHRTVSAVGPVPELKDRAEGGPLVSDFLSSQLPLEATLRQLIAIGSETSSSSGMGKAVLVNVWRFSRMSQGETLQDHVRRHAEEQGEASCTGPATEVG